MIYDFTDDIFKWRIWHIFKWITGIVIIIGICYLLWNINNGSDYDKNIKSYFKFLHISNIPLAFI